MLTKERIRVIDALFEASDQAFDAGDNKLGSLKLWAAAECALSIVAESRDWQCQTIGDHFDILKRLAAERGDADDLDLVSAYSVAGYFRNNADYNFMEDYVLKGARPSVRRFVSELLSLAERPSP